MKKGLLLLLGLLLVFTLTACAGQEPPVSTPEDSSGNSDPSTDPPGAGERQAKLVINGREYDVTLYDIPAANALYNRLPLALDFEDYNGIEKIAYLDGILPTEGEPDAFDPDIGDLCLYAPWGNLSVFYQDFRTASGLICLGHIDSGIETIAGIRENFRAVLTKK